MNTISKHAYEALTEGAEVVTRDRHGDKVLLLADGRMLKLFRRKRLISSAWWSPYAERFARAAAGLAREGIPTVVVDEVFRVPGIQRDAVVYQPLEGKTLREMLALSEKPEGLMRQLAEFVALLHAKGVYFRSLHFANIIVLPEGPFGLIDISEARLLGTPLTLVRRAQNFKHLIRYDIDTGYLRLYGLSRFVEAYAHAAALPKDQQARLVSNLVSANEAWAEGMKNG